MFFRVVTVSSPRKGAADGVTPSVAPYGAGLSVRQDPTADAMGYKSAAPPGRRNSNNPEERLFHLQLACRRLRTFEEEKLRYSDSVDSFSPSQAGRVCVTVVSQEDPCFF
jgi:hypothetical protein